jgi:hypothetical protein
MRLSFSSADLLCAMDHWYDGRRAKKELAYFICAQFFALRAKN